MAPIGVYCVGGIGEVMITIHAGVATRYGSVG